MKEKEEGEKEGRGRQGGREGELKWKGKRKAKKEKWPDLLSSLVAPAQCLQLLAKLRAGACELRRDQKQATLLPARLFRSWPAPGLCVSACAECGGRRAVWLCALPLGWPVCASFRVWCGWGAAS